MSKKAVLSLGTLILVLQAWMFVNVSVLFPADTEIWSRVILVYLVLQASLFSVTDIRNKMFGTPAIRGIMSIMVFFLGTAVILTGLAPLLLGQQWIGVTTIGVSFAVLIVHGFYVAVIEELFFRDWLASRIGVIQANLVFAVFHWAVYLANLVGIIFAFLIGLGLSQLRKLTPKTNTANIGAHWGFNGWILGMFRGA